MLFRCRGVIPAITILLCAATSGAAAPAARSAASAAAPADVPSRSTIAIADVDWMLRDDRTLLPQTVSLSDRVPLPARPVHTGALSAARTPTVPHMAAPAAGSRPTNDVNDMLVPVPVLSVGWSIALSAVLFHIGARTLRIRRGRFI
jgi:hypothetical protein